MVVVDVGDSVVEDSDVVIAEGLHCGSNEDMMCCTVEMGRCGAVCGGGVVDSNAVVCQKDEHTSPYCAGVVGGVVGGAVVEAFLVVGVAADNKDIVVDRMVGLGK